MYNQYPLNQLVMFCKIFQNLSDAQHFNEDEVKSFSEEAMEFWKSTHYYHGADQVGGCKAKSSHSCLLISQNYPNIYLNQILSSLEIKFHLRRKSNHTSFKILISL